MSTGPGRSQASGHVAVTMTSTPSGSRHAKDERCYLLCFEGDSSTMFDLPLAGEVVIGRAPVADLRVNDSLVSRAHVRLTCAGGVVSIADLGSRHGTLVNGQRLSGPRELLSGDIVSIGGVIMVLHRVSRPGVIRSLLDPIALRQRLEEEIDRALRYQRELALVVAVLGPGPADQPRVAAALAGQLRLIDCAGFLSGAELGAVLPELGAEDAEAALERLTPLLARVSPGVQVGMAACPTDGCDVDTLVCVARAAAEAAGPGAFASSATSATTMTVGDRTIVIADPAMRRVYQLLEKLGRSDLSVLISGETGTGKEIAATAVHHWSRRKDGPLVTINCAALPESLVESELFGHEKGAFTGAMAAKVGLLESASGGTVFLDELGELPLAVQAKLLRALEIQRITRVGDVRERPIDIRIIAATHRDLQKEVAEGRFREDLYFRLSVARVVLPPLRDRPRELPVLSRALLSAACTRMGREPLVLAPATAGRLFGHGWPGNVRELRNAMEYASATAEPEEREVQPWHLPDCLAGLSDVAGPSPRTGDGEPGKDAVSQADGGPRGHDMAGVAARPFRPITEEVAELERMRMIQALAATDGVQNRAAELIGMPLRTFVTKLKRYGINPSKDAHTAHKAHKERSA